MSRASLTSHADIDADMLYPPIPSALRTLTESPRPPRPGFGENSIFFVFPFQPPTPVSPLLLVGGYPPAFCKTIKTNALQNGHFVTD